MKMKAEPGYVGLNSRGGEMLPGYLIHRGNGRGVVAVDAELVDSLIKSAHAEGFAQCAKGSIIMAFGVAMLATFAWATVKLVEDDKEEK